MKYIREVSDVHLDFDIRRFSETRIYDPSKPRIEDEMDMLWYPEPMEGDLDTCLILSGDLWIKRKFLTKKHPKTGKSWFEELAPRFKYVLFVLGNHDYWDANIFYEADKVHAEITAQGLNNVYLLERDVIVLDQVKFLGGTLWTDYDRANPIVMLSATGVMNDYSRIRMGPEYRSLLPRHCLEIFGKTKKMIFDNAKKDNPDQRVVVVTHMAPAYESIAEIYRDADRNSARDQQNFYYYSDLTNDLHYTDHDIELWFHGHCHATSDYMVNKTRVICNPRGYAGYERTCYDPLWRIEV